MHIFACRHAHASALFLKHMDMHIRCTYTHTHAHAHAHSNMLALAGFAASMDESFEGLEPNGQLKPLTEANKHEFVRLSIRLLLWDQCCDALKAMRAGYVSA